MVDMLTLKANDPKKIAKTISDFVTYYNGSTVVYKESDATVDLNDYTLKNKLKVHPIVANSSFTSVYNLPGEGAILVDMKVPWQHKNTTVKNTYVESDITFMGFKTQDHFNELSYLLGAPKKDFKINPPRAPETLEFLTFEKGNITRVKKTLNTFVKCVQGTLIEEIYNGTVHVTKKKSRPKNMKTTLFYELPSRGAIMLSYANLPKKNLRTGLVDDKEIPLCGQIEFMGFREPYLDAFLFYSQELEQGLKFYSTTPPKDES